MSDRAALYNSASDIISSPPFSQRTPPTTSTTQQHFLSFDGTDEHDIVYSRLPPIPPTAPVRPFEGANCNLRSKNGARRVRSSSLEGEDPSPCSLLCVLAHEAQFSHNRRCNTNRPPLAQTPGRRYKLTPVGQINTQGVHCTHPIYRNPLTYLKNGVGYPLIDARFFGRRWRAIYILAGAFCRCSLFSKILKNKLSTSAIPRRTNKPSGPDTGTSGPRVALRRFLRCPSSEHSGIVLYKHYTHSVQLRTLKS